jgi:ATP-dependent Clp protease adaptor protein ClpS
MAVLTPTVPLQVVERKHIEQDQHKLILFNDHVNTFEWVIESLVQVCDHTPEQAEQCAFIVHSKGKYAVLVGSYDFLSPRCEALGNRGLTVEIN